MFLSYNQKGHTYARGRFLLFLQPKTKDVAADTSAPIHCLVRSCYLKQLGHFMMGTVNIAGKDITVSGTYGGDGLPVSVPQEVYDLGVPLPAELQEAWSKGGGWNGAGSEAEAVHAWALKTFPKKKR